MAKAQHTEPMSRVAQEHVSQLEPASLALKSMRLTGRRTAILLDGPLHNQTSLVTGFVKVCRDITLQKRSEDERETLLAREQAALEEATRQRSRARGLQLLTR